MKKLLLFTALFCFGITQAQNVDIPDNTFKQFLLNHYPVIDTNDDNEIQVTEAQAYTGVLLYEYFDNYCGDACLFEFPDTSSYEYYSCLENCEDNLIFIKELTGIESFINVSEIVFRNISLEDQTNIAITNFNNLTKFELNIISKYNPEFSIDLSQNINLTDVIIEANHWSDSYSFFVEGSTLTDGIIKINGLDFNGSNNINNLVVDNCFFQNFDFNIDNLVNLNTLYLVTWLFAINLENNTNLSYLQIQSGSLTSIDLSNQSNVIGLGLSGCPLSSIDISSLVNLVSLSLENTNLTEVDFSHNTNAESIYVGLNSFTALDFSNNVNLHSLRVALNSNLNYLNLNNGNNENLTFIDWYNTSSLETVCVDDINSNFALNVQSQTANTITLTEYCSLTPALSNQISGNIKYDTNANGCDASDIGLQNIMVTTTNGTESSATFTQANGDYLLYTNEGDFATTTSQNLTYITVNPATQTSNFVGFDNTDTDDFCFDANQTINDANISIYSLTEARPGFDASYQIIYNNIGTTSLDGSVVFEFDNTKLTFLNATETVNSQTSNTLAFNYTNLQPFESRIIDLNFNVSAPPTTQINDVLVYNATVNPTSGDATATDNVFTFNQTVIGSFDPNDIQVLEGEQVLFSDVDKYLHYIIRFQNTGTASAINVVVNNILDDKLDWNTLQLETTSHTSRVAITNGNDIEFIFENINLPDSTTDEPNSHGFIAYKIKPKSTVVLGDNIANVADIFFDFNEAIITNTVTTEFVNTLSVADFNTDIFSVHPNPTTDILNIESRNSIQKLEVFNNLGQQVLYQLESSTINVSKFETGLYFIKITDNNGAFEIEKFIKK